MIEIKNGWFPSQNLNEEDPLLEDMGAEKRASVQPPRRN